MAVTVSSTRGLSKKQRRFLFFILWLFTCILVSVIFLGPVLWMFFTAFKPLEEIRTWPPRLLPENWTVQNFVTAWTAQNWTRMFFNTMFLATTITVLHLFVSSVAAFAFAWLKVPFKQVIFLLVLATMIVPEQVDLIPRFLMMVSWGLTNSFIPLILLALVHGFTIFLYRQFFQSLPQELYDAALVDGASVWRFYWSIAMPLAWPATATLFIFTFLGHWNAFLYPLIYLNDRSLHTVQLGLAFFSATQAGIPIGPLMAASVFIALPPIFVYIIFQRHFMQGIIMSGVKG
ncbi:MAG: ABC-type glycerol-3-phosphate transport system, permease component [Chloroflexi bacterium AL-N5]|nr:ABC-type glycerol-3-phosphate transport system, permease component [Chloroflexi bacterium AL-N5]